MANEPRKPFQSPAPLPLPTPPGGTPPKAAEKSAPAMPLWTSGASDKLAGMPLFRGAGQKSNSLMGRLKGLKTKDVAFIGAGLAVLVMAPLAEYLISEGEEPNTLTEGFAQNGMPFPNGSDPAEVGILGLAQGGIPGEATDVITPLNARDPSTLIVGGGMGEQKEPPVAASAEPKRDAPKDSVWDKVVSSAKTGASSAARKVRLPKPGGKLAGALNGLRSLSGGSTGASLKLAAPDSKGLFSAPRISSHLAASQAVPGMRGGGSRVLAGGSGGNTAGRGGSPFGGPGGGTAGDVMSGGISGGGRGSGFSGGDGDPTKNPGGNSTKDAKTLGESLAFLRQKMEMEKAIDLKWAKKRYNELERKKMIEQTLVQTAQQAFMKVLDKLLEGKKDGGGSPGGGSPGGGSPPGGKPEGKAPEPGSPATTPAGTGPGGAAPARGELSDVAVPAAGNSAAANKSLGEQVASLGAKKGELSSYVGAINPSDDYGRQIHPPASAALKKVDAASTAFGEASKTLDGAKGKFDESNGKIGDANGKLAEGVSAYEAFKGDIQAVVKGFGEAGSPPKAEVDASKMDPSAQKVEGIAPQTTSFEAASKAVEAGHKEVGKADEGAKKAPRDLAAEIAAVEKVVAANPNCAGCAKALAVLKESEALMKQTGQSADEAVRAGGNAADRSNAARSASEGLDSLLNRGKSQFVTNPKTETATDYKKMKELEESYKTTKTKYDAETDTAAKEALKTKMDGYVTEADAIRSSAEARAAKTATWVDKRKEQLEKAKQKLGK